MSRGFFGELASSAIERPLHMPARPWLQLPCRFRRPPRRPNRLLRLWQNLRTRQESKRARRKMVIDAGTIQPFAIASGKAISRRSQSEVAKAAGLNQGHYSRIG